MSGATVLVAIATSSIIVGSLDSTGPRRLPQESVDFRGYTVGMCYSTRTGRAYIGTRPASKAYHAVDAHARKRLRQWLRAKHQRSVGATPL